MTPDGVSVPITFNPETGQYVTEAGEPVILQVEGAPTHGAMEQQQQQPDDDGGREATPQDNMEQPVPVEAVPTVDPTPLPNIRVVTAAAAEGTATAATGQDQQQIRIVNADGTVSTLANVRPSPVQQQSQQQQIRIVKLEPGTQEQQQQQHIRLVNMDGSVSAGNVRVVSSAQGGAARQIRLVKASAAAAGSGASQSPVKTLTWSQAQQMGLLSSPPAGTGGAAKLKSIRLSPTKAEGGGGGVRQVVIRGGGGGLQQQATATPSQVIRIPTSSLQPGSLQQIKVGNKIQYVRVVGAAQNVS